MAFLSCVTQDMPTLLQRHVYGTCCARITTLGTQRCLHEVILLETCRSFAYSSCCRWAGKLPNMQCPLCVHHAHQLHPRLLVHRSPCLHNLAVSDIHNISLYALVTTEYLLCFGLQAESQHHCRSLGFLRKDTPTRYSNRHADRVGVTWLFYESVRGQCCQNAEED